jgi:ABC-type transport system involved in cytochrome c biogenesis permease subunit
MGFIIRWWVNALFNGNPFVVAVTVTAVVVLSAGTFYEGLTRRDPVAIGVVSLILVGMLIVMTIAIIDRRNSAHREKRRKQARPGRR